MPPRLLNSYPANVVAYTEPSPFDKAPDLVVEIARVIGAASEIEAILEMLLAEMMGAAADPVAAVIGEIRSASTIRDLVLAAARAVLPEDELDILEIIVRIIATAVKPRDIFAHQVWEWSPDIDGVLFTHKSQTIGTSLQFGRMVRGKETPGKINPDRTATQVFTRKDIGEALGGLKRAKRLLVGFVVAKRMHDPLRTAAGDDALRQVWSTLTNEPEIVKGLSERQARRPVPGPSEPQQRLQTPRSRK